MRRRTFLALSSTAVFGLSGCSEGQSNEMKSPTESSPTATQSSTPTEGNGHPDRLSENQEVIPTGETYTIDTILVELDWWGYSDDIRYIDPETEELREMGPPSPYDTWFNVNFGVKNLGTDSISHPSFSSFRLLVQDREFGPMRELPNDVSTEMLREESSETSLGATDWLWGYEDGIGPDSKDYATLLYAIPEPSSFAYLKWEPSKEYPELSHQPIYFQMDL